LLLSSVMDNLRPWTNLSAKTSSRVGPRLIGRDKEVSALVDRLSLRRFVTIVGAPGIGKTSVAVAVARHLVSEYKDGVHFVELASVSDPALVPSAVATALGLPIWSEASIPGVVEFVHDAASELTVALLKGGSRTHVLTTSREPLRADGEWLYRLPTLAAPPPNEAFVVADDTISRANVIDGIADLTAKSLVAANVSDPTTSFYLLETTRAYAAEKLTEPAPVARRHAEHFAAFFERAEADLEMRSMPVFLEAYSRRIDDVRSALDWAFSADGDGAIGVALTVASAPIWVRLSLFPLFFLWGDVALLEEYKGRLERAIQFLSRTLEPNLRQTMKLNAALGVAILNTDGSISQMGEAFRKALEIAEDVGDLSYQMKALWGLFLECSMVGDYALGVTIARRFAAVADRLNLPNSGGDPLLGLALHHCGQHAEARLHVERAIRIAPLAPQVPWSSGYGYDDRTAGPSAGPATTGTQLSRILWIQGFADQAAAAVRDVIADAMSQDCVPSLCSALAMAACPIAFWIGDRHASRRYVDLLLEHSNKNSLAFWRDWGRSFEIIWERRYSCARAPPQAFCPAVRCCRRCSWIY
jgi:tetratricopeptide (TPR) repeat protein